MVPSAPIRLLAACAALGLACGASAQGDPTPCTAEALAAHLVCPADAVHCGPVYFEQGPAWLGAERPAGALAPPGFWWALPDAVDGVALGRDAVGELTVVAFWVSEGGEAVEAAAVCAPSRSAAAAAEAAVAGFAFAPAELRGRPARYPLVWLRGPESE